MSVGVNVGGSWKSMDKAFAKINGSWVQVGGSGSSVTITYSNYPHPIPVRAGWKYRASTDSVWIDVTSDGSINESGTFTGSVKATSVLVLDEYYDGVQDCYTVEVDSKPNAFATKTFAINDRAFVYENGYSTNAQVWMYQQPEWHGSTPSCKRTMLSSYPGTKRSSMSHFVLGNKAYIVGGNTSSSSSSRSNLVDVCDYEGNLTVGTSMNESRSNPAVFVIGNKGFVIGGYNTTSAMDLDIYDSEGNHTVKADVINYVSGSPPAFVIGNYAYWDAGGSSLYRFNSEGAVYKASVTWPIGYSTTRLTNDIPVLNDKAYIWYEHYDDIGEMVTFDSSRNITLITCPGIRHHAKAAVVNNKVYFIGGNPAKTVGSSTTTMYDDIVIYDATGNYTIIESLSEPAILGGASVFPNGDILAPFDSTLQDDGVGIDTSKLVHVITNMHTAKIPITSGSTYVLNGNLTTSDTSGVVEVTGKTTGMVEYKEGSIAI